MIEQELRALLLWCFAVLLCCRQARAEFSGMGSYDQLAFQAVGGGHIGTVEAPFSRRYPLCTTTLRLHGSQSSRPRPRTVQHLPVGLFIRHVVYMLIWPGPPLSRHGQAQTRLESDGTLLQRSLVDHDLLLTGLAPTQAR